MKKLLLLLNLILFGYSVSYSFDGLLFRPLTANPFEPRIGAMDQPSEKRVRLDIGASYDLLNYTILDSSKLSFGTDFFTYTKLRSEGKFKFPVETSDYFFGVNGSFKHQINDITLSSRLRFAHISSHLVDGLSIDNVLEYNTFVYSREFIDLAVAAEKNNIRLYAGFYSVFSKLPKTSESLITYIGFDGSNKINDWLKFQYGCDFKYFNNESISSPTGNALSIQAGFLVHQNEHTGVLLNAYYYNGRSMHGMFYYQKDCYFGIGFEVTFY